MESAIRLVLTRDHGLYIIHHATSRIYRHASAKVTSLSIFANGKVSCYNCYIITHGNSDSMRTQEMESPLFLLLHPWHSPRPSKFRTWHQLIVGTKLSKLCHLTQRRSQRFSSHMDLQCLHTQPQQRRWEEWLLTKVQMDHWRSSCLNLVLPS